MISKSEICNKSLTLVGANPIVNIDDDTNNARILKRVYDTALKSILSKCKWNFATVRKLLTLSADTLDWYHTGEVYVYNRPNNVIRIFGTNDDDATWRVEGNYIISDTQGLGIEYVAYVDDPTKYTASFIDAFNDKLCSDIAYMIVNSKTLGDKFIDKYEKISLVDAMAENAQVGVQQYMKDDAWERAKFQDGSLTA